MRIVYKIKPDSSGPDPAIQGNKQNCPRLWIARDMGGLRFATPEDDGVSCRVNRGRYRDPSDWFNCSFLKSQGMFKKNML